MLQGCLNSFILLKLTRCLGKLTEIHENFLKFQKSFCNISIRLTINYWLFSKNYA